MDTVTAIIDFLNAFFDFISNGLYDFCTKAFAEFIKWLLLAKLSFMLFAIPFAWDTAKQLMDSLNLSSILQSAWSALDSRLLNFAYMLRLPDALNLLFSAHVTKFVLRMLGL